MHKIHRYIGFIISPIIILMSITGILLNHTNELELDKKAMPQSVARLFYGVENYQAAYFNRAGVRVYRDQAGRIVSNDKSLGVCDTALLSVEQLGNQLVVVCANKLLFLNLAGELLEQAGASLGVALPFTGTQVHGDLLMLAHDQDVWALNPETLHIEQIESAVLIKLFDAGVLNRQTLLANNRAAQPVDLSVERLMLDLHAGRLLGPMGVWLLDIAAIALLLMVISGICTWRKRKKAEVLAQAQ